MDKSESKIVKSKLNDLKYTQYYRVKIIDFNYLKELPYTCTATLINPVKPFNFSIPNETIIY